MRTPNSIIALLVVHFFAAGVVYAGDSGAKFDKIVAFGDSTTDTGNVSRAECTSVPPFPPAAGFPLFWAPCTPLDPSTNLPAYFDDDLGDGFDGRLTNGPVWVEFLADALGVERPRPSAEYGTNYAHAGAKAGPDAVTGPGADYNLQVNLFPGNPVPVPTEACPQTSYDANVPVCGSEVPLVNTQIKQYLEATGGFTPRTLVVIWVGANDLRDVAIYDPSESAIANVVTNLAKAVATAASAGARRIAVLNQLNSARAPIVRAFCSESPSPSECLAQFAAIIRAFNVALGSALKNLQQQLDQEGLSATILPVDVFTVGELSVELSELFGKPFANTTEPALVPCPTEPPYPPCPKAPPYGVIAPNTEDYLFWDPIHPTERAHRIIAYRVCKTLDRQIKGLNPACGKILRGI